MLVIQEVCPRCKSATYKKNGHIHNRKQHYHGHDCGRQFVQCFEQSLISDDKRALSERLMMARIAWRGMCRAGGVTRKGLWGLLLPGWQALPEHRPVQPVTCTRHMVIQRLEGEAEAMASGGPKQAHKPWSWIARDTRS